MENGQGLKKWNWRGSHPCECAIYIPKVFYGVRLRGFSLQRTRVHQYLSRVHHIPETLSFRSRRWVSLLFTGHPQRRIHPNLFCFSVRGTRPSPRPWLRSILQGEGSLVHASTQWNPRVMLGGPAENAQAQQRSPQAPGSLGNMSKGRQMWHCLLNKVTKRVEPFNLYAQKGSHKPIV